MSLNKTNTNSKLTNQLTSALINSTRHNSTPQNYNQTSLNQNLGSSLQNPNFQNLPNNHHMLPASLANLPRSLQNSLQMQNSIQNMQNFQNAINSGNSGNTLPTSLPTSLPNSHNSIPQFNPLLANKLPFPPGLLFKPGMPPMPGMPSMMPGLNPLARLGMPPSNLNLANLDSSPRTSTKVHHHCRVCGKEFRASSLLDIHMRTHVGAKPFRCDRCPHRASQKGNLKMHMKKHHGVELPHHLDALPDAGIWCLMKPEQLHADLGEDGGPRRGVIPESELLEQTVIRVIRRIQNKFGQASLTRPSDSLEDFLKLAEESLLRDGMNLDEAMRPPSPPIVVIQQSSNGNEGRSRKRGGGNEKHSNHSLDFGKGIGGLDFGKGMEFGKMDFGKAMEFGKTMEFGKGMDFKSKNLSSSIDDLSNLAFPGSLRKTPTPTSPGLPSTCAKTGIKIEAKNESIVKSPRLHTPPSPVFNNGLGTKGSNFTNSGLNMGIPKMANSNNHSMPNLMNFVGKLNPTEQIMKTIQQSIQNSKMSAQNNLQNNGHISRLGLPKQSNLPNSLASNLPNNLLKSSNLSNNLLNSSNLTTKLPTSLPANLPSSLPNGFSNKLPHNLMPGVGGPAMMNPEMIMRALNNSRRHQMDPQSAMAAQLANMAKPHQKITENKKYKSSAAYP